MIDTMTKEQIKIIREVLATEMDRLRNKIRVLDEFDNILLDALYYKDDPEMDNENNESND